MKGVGQRRGPLPGRHKRRWTPDEDEYLERWWGERRIGVLATHVRRTKAAVRQRARVLKLCKSQHMFSASQIATMLAERREVVYYLIERGKLRATRSDVLRHSYPVWRVVAEDLEEFLRECPDLYDRRKINREEYPFWRNYADGVASRE